MQAEKTAAPSFGRRVRAAMHNVFELHTIKSSDARREKVAAVRRLVHWQDWKRRQGLIGAPLERAISIPRDLGFQVLPPGDMEHVPELVGEAQERVRNVDPSTLDDKGPRVKWGLLDMASLALDSPFLKFGLHPRIIGAITEYLGAVPVLWTADVWCSYARPGPRPPTDSEIFHCDWDAVSHVKVFVHCSEVNEDNGPLVLINATTSERVRSKIGYDYGRRVRVSDATMDSVTTPADRIVSVGPAGTVSLVDTSRCFHYGSRVSANASPRIMAMFQYVIPSAFVLPLDYRRRAPLRHLASSSLSSTQRLVLGAE